MHLKKKKTDSQLVAEAVSEKASARPSRKKLPSWTIIPILAVILLGAFGISFLTENTNSSGSGTLLKTVKAEKGTVTEIYTSTGTIESENTKTYYSPVTAPIRECLAITGQPVKSGDLLITFDTSALERDNQQAQLTLQSSLNTSQTAKEQNARAIEATNTANEHAVQQANALAEEVNDLAARTEEAYAQYQTNLVAAGTQAQANQVRREELSDIIGQKQEVIAANETVISSIDSGYAGRRADLEAAKLVPEGQRTEGQKNLIKALEPVFQQYDAAVSALSKAQTELNDAQAQLNSLQDPNIDDAGYTDLKAQYEAKYAEWQAAYQATGSTSATSGMTSSELANLNINDNLAELAALTPQELLEKGREGIKADMNGVIASVDVLQSNSVSQGMALFTIADTDNVRVRIEVSPDDYNKMNPGNIATITLAGHTYEGTLTDTDKIAITNAKGNAVIGVRIHINNPDENICIGASAKIRMTVAESKNVIVIPTEAVNASADGDFVYVIENNTVQVKNVQLGTSSSTHVEITDGLCEGELVVNDFNTDITPGMKAVADKTATE